MPASSYTSVPTSNLTGRQGSAQQRSMSPSSTASGLGSFEDSWTTPMINNRGVNQHAISASGDLGPNAPLNKEASSSTARRHRAAPFSTVSALSSSNSSQHQALMQHSALLMDAHAREEADDYLVSGESGVFALRAGIHHTSSFKIPSAIAAHTCLTFTAQSRSQGPGQHDPLVTSWLCQCAGSVHHRRWTFGPLRRLPDHLTLCQEGRERQGWLQHWRNQWKWSSACHLESHETGGQGHSRQRSYVD